MRRCMENARAGDAGADLLKAGRLFEGDNTQTASNLQGLAGRRFEHLVERLHRLGPRPLAELLIEIAHCTGQSSLIADRLQAYAGLDPELVCALGADTFPPAPLQVIR